MKIEQNAFGADHLVDMPTGCMSILQTMKPLISQNASGVTVPTTLERRRLMAKATKLTRRGRIVVTIIVIAVIWWLNDAITPDECKVSVEQMSEFCLKVMYP